MNEYYQAETMAKMGVYTDSLLFEPSCMSIRK